MKRIYNLVITGGPCAGKSVAIEELRSYLERNGFRVFLIPEVATYLMNNGIVPYGNCVSTLEFQTAIFEYQLFQEELVRKVATGLKNSSKIFILEDRALMDNKFYLSDTDFKDLLKKYGMTESEIMKRYDLVIHLVSTSAENPNLYDSNSNRFRLESIQEAKRLSDRCVKVWGKHPGFVTIDVTPTIKEKMEKIKEVVRKSMNL